MSQLHSVVLTGLGAITARGDRTLQGSTAPESTLEEKSAADFRITDFRLEDYLDSRKTYLDRCSALALAGGALALRDAGLEWPVTEAQFGITLGTHLGCLDTMRGFWDNVGERGVRLASPLLFSHSYFNTPISLCAIEFGLKGYHTTFCAGENSGLEAVRAAHDAIRLGHARAMLCGGVEALTPARERCEPGDNLGEAAVFFVLEEKEFATARGAQPVLPFVEQKLNDVQQWNDEVLPAFGHCGGAQSTLWLAWQLTAGPEASTPGQQR